jgi:ABC-type transport system substrate-binding protein
MPVVQLDGIVMLKDGVQWHSIRPVTVERFVWVSEYTEQGGWIEPAIEVSDETSLPPSPPYHPIR